MALPEPVRSYWYAACGLGERSIRTPWGVVATDRRFPLVWEANMAAVMEPAPGLTIEDIEATLHPALDAAAAPYEHIEFWETDRAGPAIGAARDRAERRNPDVVMIRGPAERAPAATPAPELDLEEVRAPTADFWPWFRTTVGEYGTTLPDAVLDQLVERTASVLVPAGLRWFVATIDGERAGYTGLISLGGVGYVEGVVTMPPFRRRGVASATVTRAIEASGAAGDRALFLLTDPHGDARRLYRKLGFRAVAEVEGCTRRRSEGWPPAV